MFRAIALFAIVQVLPAPAAAETVRSVIDGAVAHWRWSAPAVSIKRVRASFVRADVTIERGPGPISVMASSTNVDEAGRIALHVEADDDGMLRIVDRFPPRSPWSMGFAECPMPDDGHGDYLPFTARLRITLHIPAGMPLQVHSMSGRVTGAVD